MSGTWVIGSTQLPDSALSNLVDRRTDHIMACPPHDFPINWTNTSNSLMHRYDEYEEERATTVHTKNKPVDVDFVVGAVLGTGGFGLVKDGVS